MNNITLIKGIGIAATILGIGATLVSDWVGEKKLNLKIHDEVLKALAELKGTES